jgi:CheY-like chemotaxis protein
MNSHLSNGPSQRQNSEPLTSPEAQVAHDLRNVLTGILGTVGLLRETPGLPTDVTFGLTALEKAAIHARNLSMKLGGAPQPALEPAPAAIRSHTPTPEPARAPEPISSNPRILAMDDEPGIRALLEAALSHFGYDTVTVADGADAVREYQRALNEHQPYAAVIMDLTVPGGMGGKEAIKALKEIDPNVKAIVSSGCSSDPVTAEFTKHGFVGRADKPYRIQELGQIIQNALVN